METFLNEEKLNLTVVFQKDPFYGFHALLVYKNEKMLILMSSKF